MKLYARLCVHPPTFCNVECISGSALQCTLREGSGGEVEGRSWYVGGMHTQFPHCLNWPPIFDSRMVFTRPMSDSCVVFTQPSLTLGWFSLGPPPDVGLGWFALPHPFFLLLCHSAPIHTNPYGRVCVGDPFSLPFVYYSF